MLRALLPIAIVFAAPAASAQDWRQAREYEVLLSNLDIQPKTIALRAGEPVRLRFINNSSIPHSFSAGDFFAAEQIRGRERQLVSGGKVEVGPGETREIVMVPKAGRYSARCANLFHWVMGMRSEIVVE